MRPRYFHARIQQVEREEEPEHHHDRRRVWVPPPEGGQYPPQPVRYSALGAVRPPCGGPRRAEDRSGGQPRPAPDSEGPRDAAGLQAIHVVELHHHRHDPLHDEERVGSEGRPRREPLLLFQDAQARDGRMWRRGTRGRLRRHAFSRGCTCNGVQIL
eukprot:CAMPEP_0180387340 /NCGR_PEP_ID=MMETSP0989-20121125/30176_1 /TAXON_ID=697907 /ORGANISM="non described non described, Strain CCMP2293" /LENGTH=156 /DNA_ID=CAMNT_0022388175 /DNA_START=40 /DNA_END=507 /DNA_ORIENTATION=-